MSASSQRNCPKCGKTTERDAAQCPHCAAPLVAVCPQCSRTRPWYVPRCSYCDARAADASAFTGLFRQAPGERVVGNYRLVNPVATGRISAVYRAVDTSQADRVVAVKEFSTVALFRAPERRALDERFRAVVARWRALEHPALPRILDVIHERDAYYVVSEFVDGWSLRRVIQERRVRVTWRLAANWGAQLARLLGHLHASQPPLYAPFLAPAHVMVNARGEVKLVDLGLTHLFMPSGYEAHGSVPGYSAPELKTGAAPSARSDLFALGRLLYAALVGVLLERGSPGRMPLQRAVPDIPSPLVRAIARAAHRDPALRFESMADFGAELWTEMDGPLEPIDGWAQQAAAEAPAAEPVAAQPVGVSESARVQQGPLPPQRPSGARGPRARDSQGMAAFGFERDPRYGQAPTGAGPAPAARPTVAPRLSAQPRQLRELGLAGSESRRIVLTLRNSGDVPVEGRILSHVSWLSAPKKAFHLAPGKQARALLTLKAEYLSPGETLEPQALSVDSTAGRQWIAAQVEVATGPSLAVRPALLDFGTLDDDAQRSLPLTLQNIGTQPLAGRVSVQVPWLQVSRSEFRCPPATSVEVQVRLKPDSVPSGPQRVPGALVIDSDAGQERVEARAWLQRAVLELGSSQVDFGEALVGDVVERDLTLRNAGDGPLMATVRSLQPWLHARPQTVQCAPGERVRITLSADTAGLSEGKLAVAQAWRIQTNVGLATVGAAVRVLAPRLLLQAEQLSFGSLSQGQRGAATLQLHNAGSAPLEATIEPLVPWVELTTEALALAPGEEASIALAVDAARFTHAVTLDRVPLLRVRSGLSVHDVSASLQIVRAALQVDPPALDFGYVDVAGAHTRTLHIANEGTAALAWNLIPDVPWVEVSPSSGRCAPGEAQEVQLTAYALGLEAGTESAEGVLIINSDGGRLKVPLRLAIANPRLACDTTYLDLGESVNYADVAGVLRIFNYGLGQLSGSIRTDTPWLVLDRASFSCDTGRSVEVRVSTDMDEFAHDRTEATAMIHLESNGGTAEVQAALTVLLEPKIELVGRGLVLAPLEGEAREGAQGRIVLANRGLAVAHLELRASVPELELGRAFLDVKPGKRVRIGARIGARTFESLPADLTGVYVGVHHQDGSVIRIPVLIGEGLTGEPTGEESAPAPGEDSSGA